MIDWYERQDQNKVACLQLLKKTLPGMFKSMGFTKLFTTASDVCFLFVKYTITCYLYYLRNFNPSRPNPRRREKVKLNFYFHTSLWCLKRFYEGLKGLHKTF